MCGESLALDNPPNANIHAIVKPLRATSRGINWSFAQYVDCLSFFCLREGIGKGEGGAFRHVDSAIRRSQLPPPSGVPSPVNKF